LGRAYLKMIGTMMWNSTMSPEVLYAVPLSTRTRELIQGSYGRRRDPIRGRRLQSSSRRKVMRTIMATRIGAPMSSPATIPKKRMLKTHRPTWRSSGVYGHSRRGELFMNIGWLTPKKEEPETNPNHVLHDVPVWVLRRTQEPENALAQHSPATRALSKRPGS